MYLGLHSGLASSSHAFVGRPVNRSPMRSLFAGVMIATALLAGPERGLAQPANPQVEVGGPAVPDPYKMNMLIRTALIALSQANLTGNYTVLRDLGSPSFQAANSAARLTEAFTDLRRRRLDFSPILFFNPKLVREPALDEAARLRLRGFIETRPEQINFDMLFENVAGEWRLFGLAVQMQPAPADTASAAQIAPVADRATSPVKNARAPGSASQAKGPAKGPAKGK